MSSLGNHPRVIRNGAKNTKCIQCGKRRYKGALVTWVPKVGIICINCTMKFFNNRGWGMSPELETRVTELVEWQANKSLESS